MYLREVKKLCDIFRVAVRWRVSGFCLPFYAVALAVLHSSSSSFRLPFCIPYVTHKFNTKIKDKANDTLLARRVQYHEEFGRLLGKIIPVLLEEQAFSLTLFGFSPDPISLKTPLDINLEGSPAP